MGRGGPSAERFKRRRLKAEEIYLTNVSDIAKHLFITDTSLNISEIVVCRTRGYTAGIDKIVPQELAPLVKKIVVITYGGSFGFDQAIRALKDVG
jgi:peptide subunit release factor 1 (eRF1)